MHVPASYALMLCRNIVPPRLQSKVSCLGREPFNAFRVLRSTLLLIPKQASGNTSYFTN